MRYVTALVAWSLVGSSSRASEEQRSREQCEAEARDWLYDVKQWSPPGYHCICLWPVNSIGTTELYVWLWKGGHKEAKPSSWSLDGNVSVATFRKQLQKRASMKKQKRWSFLPWALLDTSGDEIKHLKGKSGVAMVFEGGRWVWPGILEGFKRNILVAGSNLTMTTLTLNPLAFTIDSFLPSNDAKHIINMARPQLKPAAVVLADGSTDKGSDLGEARSCSEAWMDRNNDAVLQSVGHRTADLTRAPLELQEDFRVLQYRPGQQFVEHTDYYEVDDFQSQPTILRELQNGRNWLVTVYLYLSTVKKGGQTYFPSTYGKPLPSATGVCTGPSVKPKRGRALMFYSLHPDASTNPSSMHGGCKVEKGVKYTINIWTFNQAPVGSNLSRLEL